VEVVGVEMDWPLNAWATRNAAGDASGTVKFPAARRIAEVFDAPACEEGAAAVFEALLVAVGRGLFAAEMELGLAVRPGFAPEPEELVCEAGVVKVVLRVWLISISCSRLFTETSWLMYSFGSVSAVGS
jgi:hypothetical protein